MSTSAYDDTSGTSTREPRALMGPLMTFSAPDEIVRLRDEREYRDGDRNSRMLAKHLDLRVLLTVLRSGAALDEQQGEARASIQALEGSLVLEVGAETVGIEPGTIAVVDAGRPWLLTARADAAVLLTLAWPPEQTEV